MLTFLVIRDSHCQASLMGHQRSGVNLLLGTVRKKRRALETSVVLDNQALLRPKNKASFSSKYTVRHDRILFYSSGWEIASLAKLQRIRCKPEAVNMVGPFITSPHSITGED